MHELRLAASQITKELKATVHISHTIMIILINMILPLFLAGTLWLDGVESRFSQKETI
jgi:hypothetical protein